MATEQQDQAGGASGPPISVVVVSRDRAEELMRCLCSLSRLLYAPYEIVVVADPAGVAAVRDSDLADLVKLLEFDDANISQARNLGISHAAGDIIAFIDDDAVAEPLWLHHLSAAFADADVAAAGGFVRGRNGISFQWRGRSVDAMGQCQDLPLSDDQTVVLTPPPGQAVKTEGTNMAVRRAVLCRIGGFDPAFHFYLDETDLNLRLAETGLKTALVPLAEVHHAYAPSPRRRKDRAVQDLFDIGASTAVFLRKHCPEPFRAEQQQLLRREQWHRLQRQHRARQLRRREVTWLLQRLEQGLTAGATRSYGPGEVAAEPLAPFKRFATRANGHHVVLAGRIWARRRLLAEARRRVLAGDTVSLFLFDPTSRRHRLQFVTPGIWLQQGGVFGRSDRAQRPFRLAGFQRRVKEERKRVALRRSLRE